MADQYKEYASEHAKPPVEGVFEQYPAAYWEVDGKPRIYFPVDSIDEEIENRLIERERPYRDGAKIDDTGSKAKRWTLTSLFENSQDEPGLDNGGMALYPDALNALAESFDVHECGDLMLPTRGKRRARAKTMSRREEIEPRDGAKVTMVFVEDNEDALTPGKISPPSVHASARKVVGDTTFDAQSSGAWNGSLADLNEFMSELEALANAPDTYAGELQEMARKTRKTAEKAMELLSKAGDEATNLLLDPANSSLGRGLLKVADTAAGVEGDAANAPDRPRTASRSWETERTLASIAAELGQSFDDLMEINLGRIENPNKIEPGTVVRVFA